MRIYLGSDHAAFELKAAVIDWLRAAGHEPVDCGPAVYDAVDDYPVYVLRAAERVVADPGSLGVVLGGSGNGEQIAANKVRGVRAALAFSDETARLAREHNNANVLSLGARMYAESDALRYVEAFIATPFSTDERHARRLAMIAGYEADGSLPPLPAGAPEPPSAGG
jgi:ribose 5-phosphate isomerase B